MIFIVTLIALLIERFFDWSHLRQWHWFFAFQHKLTQQLSGYSPYFILAASIVPLLLFVVFIQVLLTGVLYGFVNLGFQLILFLYCLGPRNLWADAFAYINLPAGSDKTLAARQLNIQNQGVLHALFIEANRRVFGVFFWYAILGPVGALLYRLIELSASEEPASSLSDSARFLAALLDWLPARLLTFIYALSGHFVQVIACWRKKVFLGLLSNDNLLTECGLAALGSEELERNNDPHYVSRQVLGLLDRTFIIMLVLVALMVLVS